MDRVSRNGKKGTVDILSETDDSELKSHLNFTKSYLSNPIVIVMTDKENYVDSINSIKNKTIAIIKGYGYVSKIVKKYPTTNYLEVENVQAGLIAVSTGKADAMFCTLALGGYTISQMGLHNIKITGKTEFDTKLAFGIRKDYPILVNIFNKAIDKITQEEQRVILDRWIKLNYVESFDWKLIFRWGLVISLLAIGFFSFLAYNNHKLALVLLW